MTRLLLLTPMLLLGSCTILPEQAPVDLYQLPPSTLEESLSEPQLQGLRIARPLTSEALSANRLLIMSDSNQLQAFPGMRLAAPTPLLWRDWLLDAFWRDGRVRALSASSEGLQSQLELGGMLRAFQILGDQARPEAFIQYDATLINTVGRIPVATRRFEARQPLGSMAVADAVDALGRAADQLVRELIDWTIEQGQVND